MRAIVFLLFVILVFLILKFTLNRIIQIRQRNRETEQNTSEKKTSDLEAQTMVRCAECGVHLPQSEAYYDGKDTFCSEGHMRDFHKKHATDTSYSDDDSD
ncbi:PP0621 family protein [Thiomicrorhabdus sp.]|uniref:PP0621 family protein n=1 Tax=Thiomicrorhabdus sp. TaxID=2039724 RepID=UPI00356155A1